jgi:hypothetical protein
MHVTPHMPQLVASVASFTQALLQEVWPGAVHVCTQPVPLQLTLPPLGAMHTTQLAPQALSSLATHVPPHECVPPVHWHEPPAQCCPPRHLEPHALQLPSSLVTSTQTPLQSV